MRFLMISAILATGLIGAATVSICWASEVEGAGDLIQLDERQCLASLSRAGESGPQATLGQAIVVATEAWTGAAAAEHGAAWADFKLAYEQGMVCAPTPSDRGQMWSCQTRGKPCRATPGVVAKDSGPASEQEEGAEVGQNNGVATVEPATATGSVDVSAPAVVSEPRARSSRKRSSTAQRREKSSYSAGISGYWVKRSQLGW